MRHYGAQPLGHSHQRAGFKIDGIGRTDFLAAITADTGQVINNGPVRRHKPKASRRADRCTFAAVPAQVWVLDRPGSQVPAYQSGNKTRHRHDRFQHWQLKIFGD